MENSLPAIPAKRYFTIGEVGDLCGVKPHVLRYWEQEFTQLRPMKRRGNRRYYQHHEVLMIRRIRDLLYDQGFTISGARNKLQEIVQEERDRRRTGEVLLEGVDVLELDGVDPEGLHDPVEFDPVLMPVNSGGPYPDVDDALNGAESARLWQVRLELKEIRTLLMADDEIQGLSRL
jgi:DNA-binding transcriptional MerR regulator